MLESEGTHAGLRWEVHTHGSGHRCGYIHVGPEHVWWMLDPDEVRGTGVHGGVTSGDRYHVRTKGYRLGFDCAGSGDAPDPALRPDKRRESENLQALGCTVKTREFCEAECRKLCDAAAAAQAEADLAALAESLDRPDREP